MLYTDWHGKLPPSPYLFRQATHPGNKWVNIFFATSFLFAGIGALWGVIVTGLIRKEHPGRFGPGFADSVGHYWRVFCSWVCCCRKYEEPAVKELNESEEVLKRLEEQGDENDPSRFHINIFGIQRAGLRLFGL